MEEPDRRAAWRKQMLMYVAWGFPTDTNSRRYYLAAALIVCVCFGAVLVAAEVAPEKGPPPTTVPVLRFPTTTP